MVVYHLQVPVLRRRVLHVISFTVLLPRKPSPKCCLLTQVKKGHLLALRSRNREIDYRWQSRNKKVIGPTCILTFVTFNYIILLFQFITCPFMGVLFKKLILWEPTHGHRLRGRPTPTFVDVLKRDAGAECTKELARCMENQR